MCVCILLSDWYALSAQAALVLQLLTLYPLLLTIIRTCVFELIYQNAWPGVFAGCLLLLPVAGCLLLILTAPCVGDSPAGRMHVAIVNAMIMAITLAFAAFYPKVRALEG